MTVARETKKTTASAKPSRAVGKQLSAPASRRAAARMVIAANEANGKSTDPRIVAIAEGKAT